MNIAVMQTGGGIPKEMKKFRSVHVQRARNSSRKVIRVALPTSYNQHLLLMRVREFPSADELSYLPPFPEILSADPFFACYDSGECSVDAFHFDVDVCQAC